MKVSVFVYKKREMLIYSYNRGAGTSEHALRTPSERGRKGTRQGEKALQICLKG
jgi:hypothetical protein